MKFPKGSPYYSVQNPPKPQQNDPDSDTMQVSQVPPIRSLRASFRQPFAIETTSASGSTYLSTYESPSLPLPGGAE
jgi:hypothetical protein